MSSETARETAVAASHAAAHSVARSPSSRPTSTNLVDTVPHADDHEQGGAYDHSDEMAANTDEDAATAVLNSFLHPLSRAPSPAAIGTKLRSTPSLEIDHPQYQDEVEANVSTGIKAFFQSGLARTTPQYQMTGDELSCLRKPGDSVTLRDGHTVQLVEDGERRRLFLSQPSSNTPPTSHQQPPSDSSNSERHSPQKKARKRVSMLASIDPSNIIDMTDAEEETSRLVTPPTSSMPPSSYSLRNRRAPQGRLIYDAKYHPMDDSIRPSQAAKRRSAHGEVDLLSDDESETFSVHSESEDEDEADGDELVKKFGSSKSKKRSRKRSESVQPTRRSSRRTTTEKISYDMKVHPQDQYLEVLSSDYGESEISSHQAKRTKTSRSRESDHALEPKHRTRSLSTIIADSDDEDEDEMEGEGTAYGNVENDQPNDDMIHIQIPHELPRLSSSSPDVTTPPSFGMRRTDEIGVYLLSPGARHLSQSHASWPIKSDLPFEIHTERLEDQLEAEANEASPLNYDEDDKENEVLDSRHGHTPDPTDGVSVMPLSLYRSMQAGSDRVSQLAASAAFYDPLYGSLSPYDLAGMDGSHDQNIDITDVKSKGDLTNRHPRLNPQPGPDDVQEQRSVVDRIMAAHSARPGDDGNLFHELRAFTPVNQGRNRVQ